MAIIELCGGGCGKGSPDKMGNWIGNNWLKVTAEDRKESTNYRASIEEYLVCRECAAKKTLNELLQRKR